MEQKRRFFFRCLTIRLQPLQGLQPVVSNQPVGLGRRLGKDLYGLNRVNTDPLAVANNLELYDPIDFGEQGVVLAHAHILAGMEAGAELTDKDVARLYELASVALDSATLSPAVTSVSSASTCLLMCHDEPP